MKIDEIDFKCQGCGACCRIKDGTRVVVDMVLYHLKALVAEGIAKLRQYASDPSVPDLAKDTELHLILFQFKGFHLYRLEEIPQ